MDPLRTISRSQKIRLEKLGATVSHTAVTATEAQLWQTPLVGKQRILLDKRGGLVISSAADIGGNVGSAPYWVPDDAKIYIEPRILDGFATGRAWTEADGIVAIDTLLGSDPNTENGWGVSGYDAADLTADGLVWTVAPPALIGAARSAVIAGATMRTLSKCVDDDGATTVALVSADGNDEVYFRVAPSNGYANAASFNGSFSTEIEAAANTGAGAKNCMALTVTTTRADFSVNGSSAVVGVLDETDRPSGNPLVAVVVDSKAAAGSSALQSITIYDALPDTTGLSELSETGA